MICDRRRQLPAALTALPSLLMERLESRQSLPPKMERGFILRVRDFFGACRTATCTATSGEHETFFLATSLLNR